MSAAALVLLFACAPGPEVCGVGWATDARDAGVPLSVETTRFGDATGAARLLGTRPISLVAPDDLPARDLDATVTIDADGVTLLDATGAPVGLPLEATVRDLPPRLFVESDSVGGDSAGDAVVTATPEGCDPVPLDLHVLAPTPLAGRTRPEAPGFGYDDVFVSGEPIEVAFDRGKEPDGIAPDVTAYVIPHRDVAGWEADPALVDVSGGAETLTLGNLTGAVVWPAAESDAAALGSAYDVVLDVDGDGTFSPGDRLDAGSDGNGIRVVGDLGAAGPHPVSQEDVSGGDWLGERVYWPDDLADLGPRPLVVISHGNGHDYTWYDYLGQHLASWGYVVMAHQNQTGPGIETASTTTLTNTDWFLANLDTVGNGALVGLVDASRIAWIGHSRGGEGVVRAYARLRDRDYTPQSFTSDDIRVIASIAPTVFNDVTVSRPYDVRYHILAGSSDGDVTGGPEYAQTQSFRLYQADTGTRSSTYIYGASHEDFDCCGISEGRGPDQLDREDVQVIAKAYLLAVVAEGVDDDPYARAVLTHDPAALPATAFATTVLSTYRDASARVIDDFQHHSEAETASSEAAVTYDVADLYEGPLDDADADLVWTGDDPMNGMTQADGLVDTALGVVFDWQSPAFYRYDLPAELADLGGGRFLSLNACQGTRHPITDDLGAPVGFAVTLVDGAGTSVTRQALSTIAPPYLRRGDGEGEGWSNAFSTVRIPLVDYTAGGTGLDLGDIRAIELEFGGSSGSAEGRLGLDDVEVAP